MERWLSAYAAKQLQRNGSPNSIRELADSFLACRDLRHKGILLDALRGLSSPQAIDSFCAYWEETRDPLLTEVLITHRWRASDSGRLGVLTALKTRQGESLLPGGTETLDALVEACGDVDPDIKAAAGVILRELQDAAAVDLLWERLEASGNPFIAEALAHIGRTARSPARLHVFSALHLGRLPEQESLDTVTALAAFAIGQDPLLAKHATAALRKLRDLATREILCQWVIDGEHSSLTSIAIQSRYSPEEPVRRALFYFLTAQWDLYETLDFDHRLLHLAYTTGTRRVRGRLAEKARQAGRTEWISTVADNRATRRLEDLTRQEWEAVCDMLTESKRWPDLWDLAQRAPPNWSAAIYRQLRECSWAPTDQREHEEFLRLSEFALQCDEEPPFLSQPMRPVISLDYNQAAVNCFAVSHDGKFAASGGSDGYLRLWDLPAAACLNSIRAHNGAVTSVCLDPEERSLATGGADGAIRLWSFPDGASRAAVFGGEKPIRSLLFGPQGEWIASGDAAGAVRLWRTRGSEPILNLGDHGDPVSCLAVSRDGRILASGGLDRAIRVWSVPDGMPLGILRGHEAAITCLAFRKADQLLVSGSTDRSLRLWKLGDGLNCAVLDSHTEPITCLALDSDDAIAATGSLDGSIRIWNLARRSLLATLGKTDRRDAHNASISGLDFCPKRNLLASGGLDGKVRLWNIPGGAPCGLMEQHRGPITCVAFAPDGQSLITADESGRICVWQSELDGWRRMPLASITAGDNDRIEQLLAHSRLSEAERRWLNFLSGAVRWRRRFDIELGEAVRLTVGEFDIEIGKDSFLPNRAPTL